MKKFFLWLLILLEVILVVALVLQIVGEKWGSGNQKVSAMPIKKEYIIFPAVRDLRYFYEFKPSTEQVTEIGEIPWLKRRVVATINADGLNERFDYSIVKPPNTFRIMTLGDSFTFGAFMNTAENYPEQLEERLNNDLICPKIKKFEVINLAVYGYDIHFSTYRFKIRGMKYHPDLVLWYLKDDDFSIPDSPIDIAEGENPDEETVKQEYQQLVEFTKVYDGALVVFTNSATPVRYKTLLKFFASTRNNIHYFEGIASYDKLPDGHPSVRGYQTIAASLLDYLKVNSIIPCD